MYAPSRHGGRAPWTTWHSVGGSSSTGAKFWDRTCLGSKEGLSGGSMKLLMMLSNAFSISAAGAHEFVFLFSSSRCCGVVLMDGTGFVFGVVVDGGGRVVVWGFSSVLTVDTAVFRRGLGGE
ncbi:hypothetical protein VIGAN_10135300 [Vigna angularis var. angularis]|uniref:Uncharacterized protein n=1 Tax=Vigna angularis var. angularis TaxID=157739 RepID=A0A0S3T4D3_PHAAN|nr:hypothetical protein VIGAN_10135300 [Vigna angularis var. angularis]